MRERMSARRIATRERRPVIRGMYKPRKKTPEEGSDLATRFPLFWYCWREACKLVRCP